MSIYGAFYMRASYYAYIHGYSYLTRDTSVAKKELINMQSWELIQIYKEETGETEVIAEDFELWLLMRDL